MLNSRRIFISNVQQTHFINNSFDTDDSYLLSKWIIFRHFLLHFDLKSDDRLQIISWLSPLSTTLFYNYHKSWVKVASCLSVNITDSWQRHISICYVMARLSQRFNQQLPLSCWCKDRIDFIYIHFISSKHWKIKHRNKLCSLKNIEISFVL